MVQSQTKACEKRRLRLFCVGLPKSGTHSIAAIFATRFRSAHEPGFEKCIQIILDRSSHMIDGAQVLAHLKERDSVMQLDMESSHALAFLAPELVYAFPESRFILTVRHPLAWLRSQINHHITNRQPAAGSARMRFRDLKFHSDFTHPPEELPLRNQGVYTLDGYLSYWAFHINSLIQIIPKEQLLILRVEHIAGSLPRIASFSGISAAELDGSKVHEYSLPKTFDILAQLNQSYLDSKIERHCGQIVAKYFHAV
ncbi:MAG: sulfotransferase [Tepidisphaeraceae bacterium]